jgi:hypothetical protein
VKQRMSETDAVRSGKDAVVATLGNLSRELGEGADWENDTLGRHLEALGALLDSIENNYINNGDPVPEDPWELMTRALKRARHLRVARRAMNDLPRRTH